MGHEVVYCFNCQTRILGQDFDKGQAFNLGRRVVCGDCARKDLEALAPDERKSLEALLAGAARDRRPGSSAKIVWNYVPGQDPERPPEYPKPSKSGKSTGRIQILSEERTGARRAKSGPTSKGPGATVLIVGLFAGVAIVAALVMSGRGNEPSPPPAAPAGPHRLPAPIEPQVSRPEGDDRRWAPAKAALEKARDFATNNPSDIYGQAAQWETAFAAARETPYFDEAKRERTRIQAKLDELIGRELAELQAQIRAHLLKKEYKGALDLCDSALNRHEAAAWKTAVSEKREGVLAELQTRFAFLRNRALQAKRAGMVDDLKSITDEVARWLLPEYPAELERALAEVRPEAAAGGPWRPVFDGQSMACLVSGLENAWRVQGGRIVHDNAVDNAAQTRESFEDGEIRLRFELKGVDKVSITVRQDGQGGGYNLRIEKPEIKSLQGEHEIIFSCRGETVTVTLDGQPRAISDKYKNPRSGKLQFNSWDGSFQVTSLDFRELR